MGECRLHFHFIKVWSWVNVPGILTRHVLSASFCMRMFVPALLQSVEIKLRPKLQVYCNEQWIRKEANASVISPKEHRKGTRNLRHLKWCFCQESDKVYNVRRLYWFTVLYFFISFLVIPFCLLSLHYNYSYLTAPFFWFFTYILILYSTRFSL